MRSHSLVSRCLLLSFAVMLSGCGHGRPKLRPGSDMAIPRSGGDQLAAALLGMCGTRAPETTADSISRQACTAMQRDSLRGQIGTVGQPPKRVP
jgi:hypothetical protein